MTRFASLRFPLIAGILFAACSAPQARIMDDNEEDLVGGNKAGSAVFDRIVNGAVKELLNKYTDKVLGGKAATGLNVAFAGVENRQREELGEWRDELNELIDTSINEYEGFRTVSQRYVAAALRETGLAVDDLFLPAKRREFFKVLEVQAGNPVKAIVFAKITGGGQEQGQTRQQRYRLTLDMVDSETGENLKADADVRKEYNR
ncbi:MAG: hypothetical protein H6835_05905 [Planctomycetes bacterium]|nr:hypothetical protein [Planctomycetota bacterium]